MTRKRASTKRTWVDPDDAPALDREWFEQADLKVGDTVVRRGRPRSDHPKVAVSIRLSEDVVQAFRASGRGWQTRIDIALRDWLAKHKVD